MQHRPDLRAATRLAIALLLATATAPTLAEDAWQPDETLPGFKANQAYDSLGVDNVNPFSGDPTIAIPLGPAYPLGGGVTWQLTAFYSSKIWQMATEYCQMGGGVVEARDIAILGGRPTLGPGWALELGEIVYEETPEYSYYRYDSPDGGRHRFYLRTVTDSHGGSATEWMTDDASDLRLTDCTGEEGVSCREVHFPDGTRRRFARDFDANPRPTQDSYRDFYYRFGTETLIEPERPRLGLSAIYDKYGKLVLSIDKDSGAFPTAVDLRPGGSASSQVILNWNNAFPVTGQLGTVYWTVLENVSFPTASSSNLLVTFNREARVFPRPSAPQPSCTLASDVPVPFLKSIRQTAAGAPGEVLSEHSFTYEEVSAEGFQSVLKTITLPTGARVVYEYDATDFAFSNGCAIASGASYSLHSPLENFDPKDPIEIRELQGFSDRSPYVIARRVYRLLGSELGELISDTRYQRVNAFCRESEGVVWPHRQVIRSDYDSAGTEVTREETLYTIEALMPSGLEVRRRTYRRDSGAFLERPVRVTVSCWEGRDQSGARTVSCGSARTGNIYDFTLDIRRQKNVTWYGDLPAGNYGTDCLETGAPTTPCLQTASEGYTDVSRRASQEVVKSNSPILMRDGRLSRTTTTTWTRHHVTDPWLFDRFSERTVSDSWDPTCPGPAPCYIPVWPPSPSSFTVQQEWDSALPAFLRTVRRTDPTQGTLVRSYEPDADGNPVKETISGSGAGIDGSRTYLLNRGFVGGRLASSRFDGVGWNRYDVTRNPATGAIVESRDPNGQGTSYVYDVLGRLIKASPPPSGNTPTRLCYVPFSSWGPYVILRRNPETTDASACSLTEVGTGTTEAFLYDGLGRLRREIRRLPSPDGVSNLAVRETRWDAAGRAVWRSEWTSCAGAVDIGACFDAALNPEPAGTTFSDFDEQGRPRSVVRPDGTTATHRFDDLEVKGSDFYEHVTEEVTPTETAMRDHRKDVFGSYIGVHAPGKNQLGHLAFYEADVFGNVAWVRDHGVPTAPGQVQLRRFDHDGLGLLRLESHPEKSVETLYTLYDPLGNLVQKVEQDKAGPRRTIRATHRFEYDAAGRLTRSTVNGLAFVENLYDTPSVDGLSTGKSLGRLVRRIGYNPGAVPSAPVVDHFLYGDIGGRLSERRTTVGATGHVFSEKTTFYNSLDLPQSFKRIRPDGSETNLTISYMFGLPNALTVNGTQIAWRARYSPFGALQEMTLGNDFVVTILPDPQGRPSSISAERPGKSGWSTGTYAYDGNGDIRGIGGETYTYDVGFRLASSNQGSLSDTFEYDLFGNIKRHIRDGLATDFAPDATTNRLTDTLGSGNLAYDYFGNLTRFPSTRAPLTAERLSFDLAGRQTRYRDSSVDERFLYDGAGERIARLLAGLGSLSSAIHELLPPASKGSPYRTGLDVSGGTPPYTWSITAGSLPPGISLNTDEGVLSGTPTAYGRYTFTLRVQDGVGAFLLRPVALRVGESYFYPLTPCRLLDTRSPDAPLWGETQRVFPAAGRCGIPQNATSIAANVTTLNGTYSNGSVRAFPAGLAVTPMASVHSYSYRRLALATQAMIGINGPQPGYFGLRNDGLAGIHVIVDVSGYFAPAPGAASSAVSSAQGWSLSFRDGQKRLALDVFNDTGGVSRTRDFYYFGPYQVASYSTLPPPEAGFRYYVSDHLGTPRFVTSGAGNTLATYSYRPFGEEAASAPASGPHFCAMEKDGNSGDHYDHARFFRSLRGRFLSPDILSGRPEDPASWNRYTYARNNPLKYVDPDGRAPRGGLGCLWCDLPSQVGTVYAIATGRDPGEIGDAMALAGLSLGVGGLVAAGPEGLGAAAFVAATEGVHSSTALGAASLLVPGGGLAAHEAQGGHTLAKHVGRTLEQLAARLASEPSRRAVSTFFDRATAEAATSDALAANAAKIAQWLTGAGYKLTLNHNAGRAVGLVVERGASSPAVGSNVSVVLVRAENELGYRVLTSFVQ